MKWNLETVRKHHPHALTRETAPYSITYAPACSSINRLIRALLKLLIKFRPLPKFMGNVKLNN
jgi:hypothetical protein